METVLKRERHGEVEKLILNRPAQENMLDDSLLSTLKKTFSEIAADSRVHCAIVTGSGESFCGGVEGGGEYFTDQDAYRNSFLIGVVRDLYLLMRAVPKPIIAAVNGLARMGGLELALASDIIVASSAAMIGDGHPAGIGGGGGSQRLIEAVGARHTRWLLYTGELLSAQRAFEIGLVQKVFDAATFDVSVLQLAQQMVSRRMGHSLARIKVLTSRTEPALADLTLDADYCAGHYFEPAVREALPAWSAANIPYRR